VAFANNSTSIAFYPNIFEIILKKFGSVKKNTFLCSVIPAQAGIPYYNMNKNVKNIGG
jgi:hypothetical protein